MVSVIQRDAGLLERGPGVRLLGMNLVVTDFFDAGGSSSLMESEWLAVSGEDIYCCLNKHLTERTQLSQRLHYKA